MDKESCDLAANTCQMNKGSYDFVSSHTLPPLALVNQTTEEEKRRE